MRALLTLALLATVAACDAPPPNATPDEDDGPVVISLLDDGTIILDDEEMTLAELAEALEETETPRGVTVKPEHDVTYGAVNEVQKVLVAAGVTKVRFVTPQ